MFFRCQETQLKPNFGWPVPYALCRVNATDDREAFSVHERLADIG